MTMMHTAEIDYHQRARALNERLITAGNVTAWGDVRDNRAEINWEWSELKDAAGPYWYDFAVGLAVLLIGEDVLDSEDPTDPLVGVTAGEIIRALSAAGINGAEIAQTGGNCATIYVGGDQDGGVWIGPGRFDWDDPTASAFDVDFVGVGPADGEQCSDVGTLGELVDMVRRFRG